MKRAIPIIRAVLVLVLIVSLAMIARTMWERRSANDSHDDARAIALPAPAPGEPQAPQASTSGSEPEPQPQDELLRLDLDALREVNPEVVGWIQIPGTQISYPLLQGKDNDYYLDHLWDKQRSPSGSIYFDYTSDPTLGGFHTIIYGHRRNDDTMFGELRFYNDLDHLQECPSVYIALADGVYRYDIFSAQEASVKSVVFRLDVEESHLEEELIRYCKDKSVIDVPIEPDTDDMILTLSTCTGHGHAARWVVHGVLAQVYGRPKDG